MSRTPSVPVRRPFQIPILPMFMRSDCHVPLAERPTGWRSRRGGHDRSVLGPIVAPGLRLLFVGINPSLRSAEAGHHFARPGNRFYPALHAAGLTPRRLRPDEDGQLPGYGIGVTNIAWRPTRDAGQ